MTHEASRAQFEIKVGGIVRTHMDERAKAMEAAQFLQQRNPAAKIAIADLRDGSAVPAAGRSRTTARASGSAAR
jgi:hypothetical protein